MKAWLARALVRLYPLPWRERYGAEFVAFLEAAGAGPGDLADVIWSAMREHVSPARGGMMDRQSETFGAVLRRPSAWVPVLMSVAALAVVLGHVAVYGAAREPDEGAAAHLWQLLMAGQLPVLLFFAAKWLRRAPRASLEVLALQMGAVLAAIAPVALLRL